MPGPTSVRARCISTGLDFTCTSPFLSPARRQRHSIQSIQFNSLQPHPHRPRRLTVHSLRPRHDRGHVDPFPPSPRRPLSFRSRGRKATGQLVSPRRRCNHAAVEIERIACRPIFPPNHAEPNPTRTRIPKAIKGPPSSCRADWEETRPRSGNWCCCECQPIRGGGPLRRDFHLGLEQWPDEDAEGRADADRAEQR